MQPPVTPQGAGGVVAPQAAPVDPALYAAPQFASASLAPTVLTIDSEALYSGSAWGQRVQAELADAGQKVSAENDRLVQELEAEEKALTALRATLDDATFRQRAEAFDARVQEVRRARDATSRDLSRQAEAQRAVFLAADEGDVTADAIARIDAGVGDGAGLAQAAEQK